MISCTPGTKTIYAGINLPEKYRHVFSSSDKNPSQQIETLDELNREENGFAMFSREAVSVSLAGADTASVVIPVERLLAKIAVFDAVPNYTLEEEGTFSALQYDVYNNNTRFYLLRNTDEYLDPNYTQAGWEAGNYKGQLITGAGFIPVEKDPLVYNDYRNVKYTPENSTEVYKDNIYSKLLETATYVVISASFQPEKVTTLINGNWLREQPNSTLPGTTFYRITYTKGTTEYVIANSLQEVQAYALETTAGQISLISKIQTYKNGRCYYTAFLDEKSNYDIRRNHFYRLYVNGFAGLGSPGYPGEPEEPGKPGKPKPDPEPDEASLLITVTLTDWYDDPEKWTW